MIKNKIKYQDYFLVFLSIALSGFIFFYHSKIFLICGTFFSFLIFKSRGKVFDSGANKYFFFILILFLAQSLLFNFFSLLSLGGLLMIVLFPYFIIKSVGKNYIPIYINIIYFFTTISFFFYIPSFLSNNIHSLISKIPGILGTDPDNLQNFILYTWEPYSNNYLRNSGPFWEPGANAGFIIIAIVLNVYKNKIIFSKKNLVFFFAILSTFSTAGYAALAIFLFTYFLMNKKLVYKVFFIPILLISAWYSYFNLEFMSEKVNKNVEYAANKKDLSSGRGRFTSAVLDMEDIIKYPITGRGRNEATRYEKQGEEFRIENHRTNGVTDYAVRYGLLGFACYFYMMYKSFQSLNNYYKFNNYFSFTNILTILTVGFSQGFFQQPTFVILIYIFYVYDKPKLF